jgi:hypothetical protein
MMKTLTAVGLALGLGFASTAFADNNYNKDPTTPLLQNESFVAQIGVGSTAIVGQTGGNNNQGTLQFGGNNFALTGQLNTTNGTKNDNSTNTAFTGQFGFGNAAVTLQKNSATVENTSAIIQAGAFNHAFVVQH